jgi:DNA-binding FadR family transcriptional regulator
MKSAFPIRLSFDGTGKAYDVLADNLRKTILDGELDVGTRLPTERELVREALRKLQTEGLITQRLASFGGNIVSKPGNDSMAHFLDLFVRAWRLPARQIHEV